MSLSSFLCTNSFSSVHRAEILILLSYIRKYLCDRQLMILLSFLSEFHHLAPASLFLWLDDHCGFSSSISMMTHISTHVKTFDWCHFFSCSFSRTLRSSSSPWPTTIIQSHSYTCCSKQILIILTMTVVPFVPASNIFFTTGFVIAERCMYLPSMGCILLLAKGFQRLSRRLPSSVTTIFQLWLIVSFTARTYQRCNDWKDEMSLFSADLKVNPNNIKLLNNVGRLYEKSSLLSESEQYFQRAIQVDPEHLRSYLNLGNLYMRIENYTAAEILYRQACQLVEDDFVQRGRVSRLQVTALVRYSELLSRDPSKSSETRKVSLGSLLCMSVRFVPFVRSFVSVSHCLSVLEHTTTFYFVTCA